MASCISSCKSGWDLSIIFGKLLRSVGIQMRMKGLERVFRRGSGLLGRANEDKGEGLKMVDDMV